MKTFVVDASVVLAYLLHEKVSVANKAAKLFKNAEQKKIIIVSTARFPWEVGNGLRFSTKDATYAREILNDFLTLPIETAFLNEAQLKVALEVAYEYGTTVYDASYHVLAIARNATFITADREYYDKAASLGHIALL